MSRKKRQPELPEPVRQTVFHFRSFEKPKEEDFCLELNASSLSTLSYDYVTQSVASHLGLDDSTKIRLSLHNHDPPQPVSEAIMCKDDLKSISYYQTSDTLHYEVLDTPLPELQGLKTLNVAFHHATKDEVMMRSITLPVDSTVGDLINDLKTKVELSHPNAELRLLSIYGCSISEIYSPRKEIKGSFSSILRAEEILEEEKNLGPLDYLIHVQHYVKSLYSYARSQTERTTQTMWFQQHPPSFYEPFLLRINEGESLAEVKVRIQKKLQVPDDEFSKCKFKFHTSRHHGEYLQDSDIVSSRFQKRDAYDTCPFLYHYICLERSGDDNIHDAAILKMKTELEKNKHKKNEKVEARDPYNLRWSPYPHFQQVDDSNHHHNAVAVNVPSSGYTKGSHPIKVGFSAAPTSASPKYPGAGQLYEGGQHCQGTLDEKFEDIGGFSVLKTQASLYKQIWLRYGHIASSQVLTASLYSVLVTVVIDIMNSVMDMSQRRFAGTTSFMLDWWDNKIKMAEKLEFNIRWLRELFERIKKDFYEKQECGTSISEEEKSLKDAEAELKAARAEVRKVEKNVSSLKAKISSLRSVQEGMNSGTLFDRLV